MKRINFVTVSTLSALFALHAWADTPPPPPPGAATPGPCKQDIQTLCPDVKPGEGRMAACFKAHSKELSPGCKAAMKSRRERARAAPGGADNPPQPSPAPSPPATPAPRS